MSLLRQCSRACVFVRDVPSVARTRRICIRVIRHISEYIHSLNDINLLNMFLKSGTYTHIRIHTHCFITWLTVYLPTVIYTLKHTHTLSPTFPHSVPCHIMSCFCNPFMPPCHVMLLQSHNLCTRRYMVAATSIPPLLLFFIAFRWLPESPRYLLSRGRIDDARAVYVC